MSALYDPPALSWWEMAGTEHAPDQIIDSYATVSSSEFIPVENAMDPPVSDSFFTSTPSSIYFHDSTSTYDSFQNQLEEEEDVDVQLSNELRTDLVQSFFSPILTDAEPLSASRLAEEAVFWNQRKRKSAKNSLLRLL